MTGTTDLAVRNGHISVQQAAALAIELGQTTWTPMQDAALAQLGIRDASDGDKAVFLHQCQRTGLDPFSRQIYMIGRQEKVPGSQNQWRTKWTIQTGIDGWRVIRSRAERREGIRGILSRPVYYDPEGSEFKVWVRREPPVAIEMTYTVREANGLETPYTSILRMDEYMQVKDNQPVAQWAMKDVHMLEKCTEADVYRKAFPQDFAGIDLADAMPAVEDMTDEQLDAAYAKATQRPRVTASQVRRTVTAEVVTPDVPPAEGRTQAATPAPVTEPAGGTSTGRPPALIASGQASQIKHHFKRLDADPDTEDGWQAILDACARINGLAAIADLKELTQDEAALVLSVVKTLPDGGSGAKALATLLEDGEVPGGQ